MLPYIGNERKKEFIRALVNHRGWYARANNLLGRYRNAETSYRRAIRLKKDYAIAYDALAVALSKSGRASEAIAFHQKAISLNPKDASYYFNLALSYLMMGHRSGALDQQQKLRQLDPRAAAKLLDIINRNRK